MHYSPQALDAALTKIRETRTSIRAAASEFHVPYTTLRSRLNGTESRRDSHVHTQRLSPLQEERLAGWILEQRAAGSAPTHDQITKFAEDVLVVQGERTPKVGKRWIKRFMARNPVMYQTLRKTKNAPPKRDAARNATPPPPPSSSSQQDTNQHPDDIISTPKSGADVRAMWRILMSAKDDGRTQALVFRKIEKAFELYAFEAVAAQRRLRRLAARVEELKAERERERASGEESEGESDEESVKVEGENEKVEGENKKVEGGRITCANSAA